VTGLAGADPDDLDDLAIAFDGFARRLHDSCSSISGRVHENPWRGPRADLFRHEWDRQFWPTIHAIIGALDNVQKILHDNANQQRQASGEAAKNYDQGNFFAKLFKQGIADVEGGLSRMTKDGFGATLARVATSLTIIDGIKHFVELGMIGGLSKLSLSSLRMAMGIADSTIESGRFLGPVLRVVAPVGLILDGVAVADDIAHKKALTGDIFHAALDAGSCVNPFVATFNASQSLTSVVMTHTPLGRELIDDSNTATLSVGATHVHGNPYEDPGAAAELSQRYAGVSGFVHWAGDSFQAAIKR
jgi:hypothetical protein